MTPRYIASSALIFCASFFLPAATASTIFTSFGPGQTYNTSGGNSVGSDFVGDNLAQGDTFTPSSTATFGSLQIALSCVTSCPDALIIDLDANSSDAPGSLIESFTVSGGALGTFGSANAPIMVNSALFPTLTAGTQYWITVSADINETIAWNWNSAGDTSDQAVSFDGGSTWSSPSGSTPGAFEIDSALTAVPEPGSLALGLWTILLSLCFVLRKRWRQA